MEVVYKVTLLICVALALVHCQQTLPAGLQGLINEKETLIKELRDNVETLWSNRCGVDCDCLAFDSCLGGLPLECSQDFGQPSECDLEGRRVMLGQSSVYFAQGYDVTSTPFRQSVCFSQKLDESFKRNLQQFPDTKWTYFGSATGTYRNYPGVIWETDDAGQCDASFDPRIRPWYVASSSGPKDVVIILDTSGSMNLQKRMEIAKNAAKSVIGTLGQGDFVNVITFAGVGNSYSPNLLQATAANKDALIQYIDSIGAVGGTSYQAGFEKLFSVLELSYQQELTSNCKTAVLFLSDGDITSGYTGQDLVDFVVSQNNGTRKSAIFTYGFGSDITSTVPKALACQNEGVYTSLPDNADLRSAMNSYYEYFAAGIQFDDVVWSEVYIDALGLGQMTSAAIACYDRGVNPPRLIGVVSTDITMEELLPLASRSVIESFLASTSRTCPNFSLDTCQLEDFRASSVGPNAVCGLGCPPPTPIEDSCNVGATGDVSPLMCNDGEREMDNKCCGAVALQVSGVATLLVAYLVSLFL